MVIQETAVLRLIGNNNLHKGYDSCFYMPPENRSYPFPIPNRMLMWISILDMIWTFLQWLYSLISICKKLSFCVYSTRTTGFNMCYYLPAVSTVVLVCIAQSTHLHFKVLEMWMVWKKCWNPCPCVIMFKCWLPLLLGGDRSPLLSGDDESLSHIINLSALKFKSLCWKCVHFQTVLP